MSSWKRDQFTREAKSIPWVLLIMWGFDNNSRIVSRNKCCFRTFKTNKGSQHKVFIDKARTLSPDYQCFHASGTLHKKVGTVLWSVMVEKHVLPYILGFTVKLLHRLFPPSLGLIITLFHRKMNCDFKLVFKYQICISFTAQPLHLSCMFCKNKAAKSWGCVDDT